MSVKEVTGGYVIDFTLNNKRFREKIPAPHNKKALNRIVDQEKIYRMAISLDDKSIASKFPNSKIIQKAFDTSCNYTIDDYANIWFKQKQRNWSHTTIRGYSQKYNTYIKPNWGHLLITEFKASMFDEWASESELSGKSINETKNVLGQVFKRAYFDGVIDKNPTERIERYKQDMREPKPFTKKEIEQILSVLKSPYKELFQFAFYTGMRTGEIIGLRWEDVDIPKKVAHVRVSITSGIEKAPKTSGSIRTVELNQKAVEAILDIKRSKYLHSKRVFIDPKTMKEYKYSDGLRKYIWKPSLVKAKVLYRYPYQTRHTYASMMLSSGKPPVWVAKQLGHSNMSMLYRVYGRWIDNKGPIDEQ